MSKQKSKPSPQTVAESEAVAKATQRPGQTKQETRLIAQGIQKGIEQYKKQHKIKSRELDKRLRKAKAHTSLKDEAETVDELPSKPAQNARLPWVLLIASWGLFGAYLLLTQS